MDYQKYFLFPVTPIEYYYLYFVIAAVIAFFLVSRSETKYKIEVFFISVYLLTGNINHILTIKIPGFSLFEIQPVRLVFLLLVFLILRKTVLAAKKPEIQKKRTVLWFEIALYAFVILLITSVAVNAANIGLDVVISKTVDAITFLGILIGIRMIADESAYKIIGYSFIVGAVVTSLVSLVQFTIDPYFMRIGDFRPAFGDVIRANGIFKTEYFNSYYLITAIVWALISIKREVVKFVLISLFIAGIITTFQRMSWIILVVVLSIYFIIINRMAISKMIYYALLGLTLFLGISLFYYNDIVKSSLVQERLTDNIDRRQGYYSLVLNNIGQKPLFGYGDLKNEVYYVNIMRITESRDRATAESGDLHSGYFSALFLHGIPAAIFFTLFIISTVWHFASVFREHVYYILPFLVGIIYMIGNLTNTFLFLKYVSVILAIHIGIGLGIKELHANKTNPSPV